jgi:Protein of unknown function (DUF4019)
MSATDSISRRRFAAALAALAWAPAFAQDPTATLAQRTAREWLAYTDALDGAAAYARAAAKFRSAMPVDAWTDALRKQRMPRGATKRRTIVHTEFRRDVPGYPNGDYALVVFQTEFENADAQESITLEREADNVWRVVGYLIR